MAVVVCRMITIESKQPKGKIMKNSNKAWKNKPNKYSKKATDWTSIGFIAAIITIAPFAWFAAAMIGKTMVGA